MKNTFFYILLLFIFSQNLRAQIDVQVGDILLQPMNCWACKLIEEEEETIYSHIGIAIKYQNEIFVAEAYGKVRKVSLVEFNQKTQKDQKIKVLRFRNEELQREFSDRNADLIDLFETEFNSLQYDSQFLWNNVDLNGNEKLYCSEFVSKFLQASFGLETPVKRMHFEKNRDGWMKFFKGNIPDGKWGNSPADFEKSELFYEVGEL